MTEFWGTTKIKKPKTLQKWIDLGWYQKLIKDGYIFAVGCGRFRKFKCECTKCRNYPNLSLQKVLNDNYKTLKITEP